MTRKYLQNIILCTNYKAITTLFIVFSTISSINLLTPVFAQQQQQGGGVNWLEICKNPIVDALITEPCETLTSPDGYTLTSEGEHVLGCIGGGTLAVLIGQPELLALKNAVGCGGNSGSASTAFNQTNATSTNTTITSLPIKNETYKFVRQWGSNGTGDGQFNDPRGIAVDSSGNVYVADNGNNRIQKFDSNGSFITKWGSTGSKEGQFISTPALAVDYSGQVYVTDNGNNRIQVFAPVNQNYIHNNGNNHTDNIGNTIIQSHAGISDQF